MKNYKSTFCSIVLILTGALILFGCSSEDNSKMPLTTDSQLALEYYQKGVELSDNVRRREAVKYFNKALEEDSNFVMAQLRLSLTYDGAGKFIEILPDLLEKVDQVSEGEKLLILGHNAGLQGDLLKQLELNQQLVDLYPLDERARMQLGNHYYGQQKFDKAIEQFNYIIEEINQDYSPAYNMLGYSFRMVKNYSEAEKQLLRYIELIPNDPNPYDSYAELMMKIGRFDESIVTYRKALSIDPYFSFSHIGIASNLNFQDKHIEARNQLQIMFETAKTDDLRRNALFAMVVSYIDQGNFESAIKKMNEVLEYCRKMQDVASIFNTQFNFVNLYLEAGKLDEAERKINELDGTLDNLDIPDAIIENGRRALILLNARLNIARGNLEDARTLTKEYEQQVENANNANQIRNSHELNGLLALAESDYQKANEEFRQGNQQNPYNLYRLGLAYEQLGENDKAIGFYNKAANYNTLNDINYAYIRLKAKAKVDSLII